MKSKRQNKVRWWVLIAMCIVAITSQAATISIQGFSSIGEYQGYPLFEVSSSTITVSSSSGQFDYVYLDGTQIAYNNDSYWSSYSINISSYMDGAPHKLQLKKSSSDYGICYFQGGIDTSLNGIWYGVENDNAYVAYAKMDLENAEILSEYTIDGKTYSVTSIKSSAFSGHSALKSVIIPNSITSIGNSAFYNCTALTAVAIPEGVSQIGESAFKGCSALANLTFNAENCTSCGSSSNPAFPSSITNLTLGDKVTKIPAYFLYSGSSIENLTIPNSVTSIGNYAFRYSNSLKSVTVGAGVISISNYAFDNCNIIKAFWLGNTPPEGVNRINTKVNYVSNNQYNLNNQIVYQFLSSKFMVNGTVYVPVSPSERTCDVIDCIYNPTVTDLSISDKVSNRGIEMTVNDICKYSYYNNDYIQTLTLSNLGKVGAYAFCGCDNLSSIATTNKGDIGDYSFYGCNNSVMATICNEGNIGVSAFEGLTKLHTAILGQKVTGINESSFAGCSSLTNIIIPNSVTSLGTYSFKNCTLLENVSIGNGVPNLPYGVFSRCSALSSIVIPNNVKSINDYAFSGCSSLSDVTIEDSEIVEDNPTSRSFPNWTSTNHQDGSTSYQEYTFTVVPNDVLSFNYTVDSESGYDKLIIEINGAEVLSVSGSQNNSFTKTFTQSEEIVLYMAYIKDSSNSSGRDEASVSDIWLNGSNYNDNLALGSNGSNPLFSDCPLDEVYIGRKLSYKTSSSYGYSPFYRNTSLRTVEITDAETQIYDNEFYGCSNLKSLKIGNGVQTIGNWAFSGCSSLDYFSAGYHVESIGAEAFSDCTGLTKYYSYSIIPPTCGNQALDDINKWDCTLYVPANSSDEYKVANQWKEFFFVEEMDGVYVAEIRLDKESLILNVNESYQLQVEVLPGNATNATLRWTSTNPEIATVTNGMISAISKGTTEIIAEATDGSGVTAICQLTVEDLTGIEDVNFDDVKVYVSGRTIHIDNAPSIACRVIQLNGVVIYFDNSDIEFKEFEATATGAYVVMVGAKAYKVLIK